MSLLEDVARHLESRRNVEGWSKTELARRAGVSPGTVARALNPATVGKVRIHTLARVVRTLRAEIRVGYVPNPS